MQNRRDDHERAARAVYGMTPEHWLHQMLAIRLQPWQRAFVTMFAEHHATYGQTRLLLGDEVGLGKTLSLAASAMLSALCDVGRGDVTEFVERLLERPEDGRVKMYVTARALNFRRARRELFARGDYLPLRAAGRRAESVVSFARALDGDAVIVVAARFFTRLGVGRSGPLGLGRSAWGDTRLPVGESAAGRYRDVFTGREFDAQEGDGALALAEVLSPLPVALLFRE